MSETPLEGLSREELEQRLAHALAVGDDVAAGDAEIRLAACLLDAGEAAEARKHGERAVALQRRVRDEHDLARALEVFGHACRDLGDAPAATSAYLEAIDLEGRHGHRHLVAALLHELGVMAQSSGDRDRARDLLRAALRTAPEQRDESAQRAELGLAQLELEDGDDHTAARRALRVLQGGAEGELALACALLLRDAGMAARRRGDNEAALHRYEFALPVVRRQANVPMLVGLLVDLGSAGRATGQPEIARGHFEEAVRHTGEEWDADPQDAVEFRAALLHDLGDMALREQDDPGAAVAYLEAALEASETAGSLERSFQVTGRLHQACLARGDVAAAEKWRAALGRAAFAANVARVAVSLLGRGTEPPPLRTAVFGDSGAEPRLIRVPGGRLADGLLWRRRLAAEVRRAAPLRRLAVLRGGMQASAATGPLGEAVWMFLVERDSVEVRVAQVRRESGGVTCHAWHGAEEPGWPGSRDGLVEALRTALR
jgi:tetratricopeptide (TPR) repeat protein